MPVLSRHIKTKISLIGAACLVWALGFADLARGGTTLSAVLLVVAYCVVIPLAIWYPWSPLEREPDRADRPSYRAAGLVALGVLVLYLLTMAPSTAMWDASEYITAAYTFGLPHPPGNPFFVIIGHLFTLLPIGAGIAARVNVLAALSSAVAAGCGS